MESKELCAALRDFVPFVQFKKRENTHGGVLLLVTVSHLAKRLIKRVGGLVLLK